MTSQSGSGVSYVELPSGVDLQVPGLVVEFELLPDLTLQPEWGAEVTAVLRHTLDRCAASDGMAGALWVTPPTFGSSCARRCCAKARSGTRWWPASTCAPRRRGHGVDREHGRQKGT